MTSRKPRVSPRTPSAVQLRIAAALLSALAVVAVVGAASPAEATPRFSITASAVNGTISPPGASVGYSGDATFFIWPDQGYHLVDVLVNGSPVGAVGSYTFINVFSNQTISAIFEIDDCLLSYAAGAGGSVAGASSQSVKHGASGTPVTAAPDAGFHFVAWSDGVTSATRTEIAVASSLSVTACFAPNPGGPVTRIAGVSSTWATTTPVFSLWASGDAPPFLTYYSVNGSVPALYLAPVPVFAPGTSAVRYWSVDSRGWGESAASTTIRYDPFPPVTSLYGVTPGAAYTAPVDLALFALDNAGGSRVAAAWYAIDGGAPRTYDGAPVRIDTLGSHTLTYWSMDNAGNTEAAHLATFTIEARRHLLTYAAGPGGTLTGSTAQTVDDRGSGTPVAAVPDAGHHFVGWSDGASTPVRTDANVTADLAVSAAFAVDPVEPVATSITIAVGSPTAFIGRTAVLSGTVTPHSTIGVDIVVYVQKPGGARWTYSSLRTVYALGATAAWRYGYTFKRGMTRGVYRFKAAVPAPGSAASPAFLASFSRTMAVTVR